MKSVKLQTELLKMAEKRDGWRHAAFSSYYFEVEDRIWVSPDGNWMMGIPKKQFYLDIVTVWNGRETTSIGKILRYSSDADIVIDSGEIKQKIIGKKKLLLHKLLNQKGEEIFVNGNYLKYFDNAPLFKGTTPKSPIYVYEFDELVGIIMPFNKPKTSK